MRGRFLARPCTHLRVAFVRNAATLEDLLARVGSTQLSRAGLCWLQDYEPCLCFLTTPWKESQSMSLHVVFI